MYNTQRNVIDLNTLELLWHAALFREDIQDPPTGISEASAHYRLAVLICPVFDEGPRVHMEPQKGVAPKHDYPLSPAKFPERIFGWTTENPGARNT